MEALTIHANRDWYWFLNKCPRSRSWSNFDLFWSRPLSLIKINHISKSNERLPLNQLYIAIKIVPVVKISFLIVKKLKEKKIIDKFKPPKKL